MNLYQIDSQIAGLLTLLDADVETGEVRDDVGDVLAELELLDMERTAAMQDIAKEVLNLRAASEALKAEQKRLKERMDATTRKADKLVELLGRACGGVRTDLEVATLSYRRSERTEVTDPKAAWGWLSVRGLTDCFRVPDPVIDKANVKRLIKGGEVVPGCAVVETVNVNLK